MEKKIIGVCLSSIQQIEIQRVLKRLARMAEEKGYRLAVFAPYSGFYSEGPSEIEEQHVFNYINYSDLAALVIFCAYIKDRKIINKLARNARMEGIPVITIKETVPGCCSILFDSKGAVREMINHLITVHNCRKIYFFAGVAGVPSSDERLQVYKEVMSEHGLETSASDIYYGGFWGGPTRLEMEQIIEEVKNGRELPDAIVCANDSMALEVCDCLAEAGIRVPEDVKVTGMGGLKDREYHMPLLTTGLYDPKLTAVTVMDCIEKISTGEIPYDKEVLCPCRIDYAESCGCRKVEREDSDKKLDKVYATLERERIYNRGMQDMMETANLDDSFESFLGEFEYQFKKTGAERGNFYLTSEISKKMKLTASGNENDEVMMVTSILPARRTDMYHYLSISEMWQNDVKYSTSGKHMVYFPLSKAGTFFGIITLAYGGEEVDLDCLYNFVMTVDNILSFKLKREEIIEANQQINMVSEQTILSLAEIVEAKSEFTGFHVKRVSEYTRILAETLGYDKDEVDVLRVASMMHDIGKINIPSDILEKPGKLTTEEFEVIKTHVTEGEKILHSSPGKIMQMARTIALEHHEKWDGTGYLGKVGEETSIESRIVALADVFDALVSKRPYKDMFPPDYAYREIVSERGTHFDAKVVDAFEECYDEFCEIHAKYGDK